MNVNHPDWGPLPTEKPGQVDDRLTAAELLLREAVACIEGLAQQQAMPDDSYRPVLERIKRHLESGS